jgi:hypothetical protein
LTRPYNWQLMLRLARTMAFNRAEPKKENAPHKAGHYLNLVARGGIEPPTQEFVISQCHQIEINDYENRGAKFRHPIFKP